MSKTWRRRSMGIALAGACLFAGPCGITTLQFRDFVTSTLIRTTVTTLASVIEAAIVVGAQESDAAEP